MVKTRRRDYDLYENDPAAGDNNSVARFKDDLDHFNVPVDSNKDFISHMPAEVIEQILSRVLMTMIPSGP